MKKYTVFLLCLTVFWLFADQNLMAPNLSAIADEFGMSDSERDEKLGGFVAIGFFIVGAPAALIIGYLTDKFNRCILFAFVVFLGEIFCFATYWVQTYEELLACRIMTGISIGGSTPIIFSLLGDLYPENQRVYVSTLIGISMSAGIGCGQLLAGITGPTYGWRVSFLMVSVPAILCGLLVGFTVKEPIRGNQEKEIRGLRQLHRQQHQVKHYGSTSATTIVKDCTEPHETAVGTQNPMQYHEIGTLVRSESHSEYKRPTPVSDINEDSDTEDSTHIDYSEKIEWSKLVKLFHTSSAVLIFVQGLPGCLPWGIVYVFLNDYFSADLGMSVADATAALTCFAVGGAVGQLGGGWVGQRLYDRDARYQCVLMGSTTMLSVFPMIYLLNTVTPGDPFFYVMTFFTGVLVSINGPNARAVLQNVCSPEVRGCAFAVFMLTDDIGKGLGPAIVVLFIQAFNGDRRAAFSVVTLAWLVCGALLLLLVLFVRHDEEAVQARIRESLLAHSNLQVTDGEVSEVSGKTVREGSSQKHSAIIVTATFPSSPCLRQSAQYTDSSSQMNIKSPPKFRFKERPNDEDSTPSNSLQQCLINLPTDTTVVPLNQKKERVSKTTTAGSKLRLHLPSALESKQFNNGFKYGSAASESDEDTPEVKVDV